MANINNVRKTFTNLSDPQQLRELNRQMEWLWHQLFGGLTEKAFAAGYETRTVKKIQDKIAVNLDVDDASIDNLKAALARIMVAQIAVANLDFAQIRDFVANAMVLDRGTADNVYIKNLTVTSANLLNAVISNLILLGDDDHYYTVSVNSEGQIFTEDVTDDLTAEEIEEGVTGDGHRIYSADVINAEEIYGSYISAADGDFIRIIAGTIEAGTLNATEAVIGAAAIPDLRATAITAFENSLNLYSNESINLIVKNLQDNINRLVRLDANGLHVGDNQSNNELLLDSQSLNVRIGSQTYSKFSANYVQFGNYQLRRTADGGLGFKLSNA